MLTRRRRILCLGLGVALALLAIAPLAAMPAEAGEKARVKKALKDKRLQTRKLFGLEWHNEWKAAVVRNRVNARNSRPIVFLRILGDLAAAT